MLKLKNGQADVRQVFAPGLVCLLALSFLLVSCSTTPTLPPRPQQHVFKEEKTAGPSVNSLWSDTSGLYDDIKARRLNDLVTIKVVENIKGSGTADTKTSRDSSLEASASTMFGLNTSNLFGKGNTISPNVTGAMKNDFKGSGGTTREGKLIGTITARVVQVMPNGNLLLEARKDITINNEKQILVLRGMIRPNDVASDNTVQSSSLADAEVFYVGDGIIQDKQGQGWLVKLLDRAWPF